MLESYEVGQKLTAEDFVSDLFFPSAKWDYAEVTEITDNTATLRYVNEEDQLEESVMWSKEEMAEMFGWNIEKDENVFDIVDEREDQTEELVTEDIVTMAYNSHTASINGSYELLDAPIPMFIHVKSGKVKSAHIFSDDISCIKAFRSIKG